MLIFSSIHELWSPNARTAGKGAEANSGDSEAPVQESCQVADFHRNLFKVVAKDLTVWVSSLYFLVCQGRFFPEWGGSKWFGVVELEGNIFGPGTK